MANEENNDHLAWIYPSSSREPAFVHRQPPKKASVIGLPSKVREQIFNHILDDFARYSNQDRDNMTIHLPRSKALEARVGLSARSCALTSVPETDQALWDKPAIQGQFRELWVRRSTLLIQPYIVYETNEPATTQNLTRKLWSRRSGHFIPHIERVTIQPLLYPDIAFDFPPFLINNVMRIKYTTP